MPLLINRDLFFPERPNKNGNKSSEPKQILQKNHERSIPTEVAPNRKVAVVLRVLMDDNKGKKKAVEALVRLSVTCVGINSFSVNGKHQKLSVIGEKDPIQLVTKLRERVRFCEIVSVRPAEEQRRALSSSVTQAARGKQKLIEDKTHLDDEIVSDIGQLLQSMNISAQVEASTSLSMSCLESRSFPRHPCTAMLDQDRTKDVMLERKRLLDEQEMSINRIVELEKLLGTQKAFLATERVVLEELIAKDEQLEEVNRALEIEKKKKNEYYLQGVEDCRLKILEHYPELDLSWMHSEFGFKTDAAQQHM